MDVDKKLDAVMEVINNLGNKHQKALRELTRKEEMLVLSHEKLEDKDKEIERLSKEIEKLQKELDEYRDPYAKVMTQVLSNIEQIVIIKLSGFDANLKMDEIYMKILDGFMPHFPYFNLRQIQKIGLKTYKITIYNCVGRQKNKIFNYENIELLIEKYNEHISHVGSSSNSSIIDKGK